MSARNNSVTPRKRLSNRRRRSPNYTSKSREDESRRRERTILSPRYRRTESKSSTRYRKEKSTRRNKRSSRRRSWSPSYRGSDVDHKEELWGSGSQRRGSQKRKERASYPSRVENSRRPSQRDVPRGRSHSHSDFWSKECKFSEVIPECRLRNIEASGGSRDFRKWFGKLPPNCRVDKDVRTDRGVFRKDNFQSSSALVRYLGINNRSPSDRKRRW